MMRRFWRRWIETSLVLMVVGVAVGCSPQAALEPQVREIIGREYSFEPAEVRVAAGRPVRIHFVNEGSEPHNWVVPDLDDVATAIIEGGQEATLEFTVNRPGEYLIFCSVPGHVALGMIGKLIVE